MELERKQAYIGPEEDEVTMDYIHPLEEVDMGRYTDFHYVRVPTEQGRLLLEFIRRHIFNRDIEK
jgi:hypothetical protein